jgi:hypothetical protein
MIHSSIIIVVHMILYSIQLQASHGNWSCYANKPTMQIKTFIAWPVAMAGFITEYYNYTYKSKKLLALKVFI